METVIESDGAALRAHLAVSPGRDGAAGAAPKGPGLVLCHGFPAGPRGAATTAQTYPELADRLAADADWSVLAVNLRGTGDSTGEFSLGGWLSDIHNSVAYLRAQPGVSVVWLAGFGVGGSLALCAAGEDGAIGGVAAFSAPADFQQWAEDPVQALEHARAIGLIRRASFPPSFDDWSRELHEIRPLALIGKVPPRPVMLVHGSDDATVALMDARALADAAEGEVDLRILAGAGSRLRHDPRAIAVLLGWLDRNR